MRNLNTIFAVAAFLGFSAAALAANPQSDTIPTSQLVGSFSVLAVSGSNQVTVSATFVQAVVSGGQLSLVALDQSSDDVVTFTQGSSTVTYDPSNTAADVMPFVAGGTYTINFKRFNGETYTSTATAPGLATVTQPAASQVFEKTDAVTIDWTAPTVGSPALFAVGTNCGTASGAINYNASYTSATIAAGYSSSCSGPVQMVFDAFYETAGAGFGSFTGIAQTSVQFSYGASLPPETTTTLHSPALMKKIMTALRRHQKTMKYTF